MVTNAQWIVAASSSAGWIAEEPAEVPLSTGASSGPYSPRLFSTNLVYPDQASLAAYALARAYLATCNEVYLHVAQSYIGWYEKEMSLRRSYVASRPDYFVPQFCVHNTTPPPSSTNCATRYSTSGPNAQLSAWRNPDGSTHADSTDAYAAFFLVALDEVASLPATPHHQSIYLAATRAFESMLISEDPRDSLTYATPTWHEKYLMDEAASYRGALAAADIFRRREPNLARLATALASSIRRSVNHELCRTKHNLPCDDSMFTTVVDSDPEMLVATDTPRRLEGVLDPLTTQANATAIWFGVALPRVASSVMHHLARVQSPRSLQNLNFAHVVGAEYYVALAAQSAGDYVLAERWLDALNSLYASPSSQHWPYSVSSAAESLLANLAQSQHRYQLTP